MSVGLLLSQTELLLFPRFSAVIKRLLKGLLFFHRAISIVLIGMFTALDVVSVERLVVAKVGPVLAVLLEVLRVGVLRVALGVVVIQAVGVTVVVFTVEGAASAVAANLNQHN